jgi:hypothetical protein
VLGALRQGGINVQEMQNTIFDGGRAACARIHVVGAPTPEICALVAQDEAVFSVTVTAV